jgi:hypothetical protein
MARRREFGSRDRQRGWVGLIGLILALVIVGMLVKTVMDQYGLTRKPGTAQQATGLGPVPQDAAVDPPSPRNAMERARGLEASVQQQAAEQAKRIDDVLKKTQ